VKWPSLSKGFLMSCCLGRRWTPPVNIFLFPQFSTGRVPRQPSPCPDQSRRRPAVCLLARGTRQRRAIKTASSEGTANRSRPGLPATTSRKHRPLELFLVSSTVAGPASGAVSPPRIPSFPPTPSCANEQPSNQKQKTEGPWTRVPRAQTMNAGPCSAPPKLRVQHPGR